MKRQHKERWGEEENEVVEVDGEGANIWQLGSFLLLLFSPIQNSQSLSSLFILFMRQPAPNQVIYLFQSLQLCIIIQLGTAFQIDFLLYMFL